MPEDRPQRDTDQPLLPDWQRRILDERARAPLGSRLAARFARVGLREDISEQRGQPARPADFES